MPRKKRQEEVPLAEEYGLEGFVKYDDDLEEEYGMADPDEVDWKKEEKEEEERQYVLDFMERMEDIDDPSELEEADKKLLKKIIKKAKHFEDLMDGDWD